MNDGVIYRRKGDEARRWAERTFGVRFHKRRLPVATDAVHEYDLVSEDGAILGEVRSSEVPTKGRLRPTQLAEMSEAALFLLAQPAARERMLLLTDPAFHRAFVQTPVAKAMEAQRVHIHLVPARL